MKTEHLFYFADSKNLSCIEDGKIGLIVTSPPYPMISMWDTIFAEQDPKIGIAITDNKPNEAFDLMHQLLDNVWKECYRVLKEGGFLCINIGDATRSINDDFRLYNNHSKIIQSCIKLGFSNLPGIIWHKPTNAPNKFMGSGMLPCGAYMTLEHEQILIFRKSGKRLFKKQSEKEDRKKSAYFWEERNVWFSDIWDLAGTKQRIVNPDSRERSAAFPLEIPYRLINMYSQMGDWVLDPFSGLGTTTQAAMILGRNSISYEIDKGLKYNIANLIDSMDVNKINRSILTRYQQHMFFVKEYTQTKGQLKHFNKYFNCPVMTSQEETMELHYLTIVKKVSDVDLHYVCSYEEQSDFAKIT